MGFRHANGCFRFGGGFSDFVALISTVILTEKMKGPEFFFFSCFSDFINISPQVLSFSLGKKRLDLSTFSIFEGTQ